MKPWQRAILTASVIAGMVGCGTARHVEGGTIIEKQDLPEEKALYINLDSDTTNAERKLFFDDSNVAAFRYAETGDYIEYTNKRGRKYIYVGYGDKVIRINGNRVARIRRNKER